MNQKTIITKIIKDQIWINVDNNDVLAFIKGQIRLNNIKPAIGDYVQYEKINDNQYLINEILERKNFLIRPKVANVDVVAIVQSTITPDFDSYLIDKMICFYEQFNVDVVLIITKSDIFMNQQITNTLNDYRKMNYLSFDVNNKNNFEEMINYFKDKIVCFVGNSGAGKSTLINKIEPNLSLKTQVVSTALNRGKHTTTNSCLFKTNGFYLIDTPGYSTISLQFDQKTLANLFFNKLLHNSTCKFNDCLHLEKNINCEIINLLNKGILVKWRYENYLSLLNSKEIKEYDKYKK